MVDEGAAGEELPSDAESTATPAITRLSGEFEAPEVEGLYLSAKWSRRARLIRTTCLVFALAFFASLSLDLHHYSEDPLLPLYLVVRVIGGAAMLVPAYVVRRGPYHPKMGRALAIATLLVTISFLVVTFPLRDRVLYLLLSALAMVLGNYLFLPNRFAYTLGVALLYTTGFLVMTVGLGAAPAEEKTLTLILLVAINGMGIALTRSVNRASRGEWAKARALERAVARRIRAEESAAIDRAKSRFFMNLSHELRTPINGIVGYVDLIDEQVESGDLETLRADLHAIRRSGVRLQRTLSNILEMSRIESGQVDVRPTVVDLEEVVGEAVGEVTELAAERGNAVEVTLAVRELFTDRSLLRHCLVTLMDNAARFTEGGTIRVSSRGSGARVKISVEDTGVGIDASRLEGLFVTFTRADESQSGGHQGSGISLAVARRFSAMLGGAVHVESTPGEGSTFTIDLPAGPTPTRRRV